MPHVAPPRRETLNGRPIALDWPKARVLSAHEDVAAALATVRDLEATTDAELLVLAVPMPPSDVVQAGLMPPWFSIAEGHRSVAWARLERRAAGTGRRDVGIPRARLARDGRRLLCGWSTCGGVIAELIDLPVGAESRVSPLTKCDLALPTAWDGASTRWRRSSGLGKTASEGASDLGRPRSGPPS